VTVKTETTIETSVAPGASHPLGARTFQNGVNFSVYSKDADYLELLLYDTEDAPYPNRILRLDPKRNRTYHFWHCFVPDIGMGQVYAYRAHGRFAPEQGLRFDGSKVLLDPYGLSVVNWQNYDRVAAIKKGDNSPQALRSVVFDIHSYDWEGDQHPRIPYSRSVIYELHLKGFTANENSGVGADKRGTFAGLIEKIPYLQELGITAVELLPIHQFDDQDAAPGLKNYWGYSTINFFAPHHNYSARTDPFGAVEEFRDMVKALHKAGIEVILDVVFNHSAEGNELGPTLCFRGLDNRSYYMLDKTKETYLNYSGCGNTMNGNHPIVGQMILDSLRYWVSHMHVDGFRFDLASVLTRDVFGVPMERPNVLWNMEMDPVLAGSKLIVEAWDAQGLYQVGTFINKSDYFAEWNGPFRDDVRRFIKADKNSVRNCASRILGSSDIYVKTSRDPNRSINYVTCHDGFTLNDVVSYNVKHNLANGERNRDGMNDNNSWNCGVEGPTSDQQIEALRLQQIKNFYTIHFFSQGAPMLLMGDEVRRTQQGNNNAYCQDSELSWFDWNLLDKNKDLLRFVKKVIAFTQVLNIFTTDILMALTHTCDVPHVTWHGTKLYHPDWSEDSHSLAYTMHDAQAGERLHIMLNAFWQPLSFELPDHGEKEAWYRVIDTSLKAPDDFCDFGDNNTSLPLHATYEIAARSCVVLVAKTAN
jgi:glycogen operon protein